MKDKLTLEDCLLIAADFDSKDELFLKKPYIYNTLYSEGWINRLYPGSVGKCDDKLLLSYLKRWAEEDGLSLEKEISKMKLQNYKIKDLLNLNEGIKS